MKLKETRGQVKYHPGNRRLEFEDGRNWETASNTRTTSRGLRTGRHAIIGSHSNQLRWLHSKKKWKNGRGLK
jgi:hypothetical protein